MIEYDARVPAQLGYFRWRKPLQVHRRNAGWQMKAGAVLARAHAADRRVNRDDKDLEPCILGSSDELPGRGLGGLDVELEPAARRARAIGLLHGNARLGTQHHAGV